ASSTATSRSLTPYSVPTTLASRLISLHSLSVLSPLHPSPTRRSSDLSRPAIRPCPAPPGGRRPRRRTWTTAHWSGSCRCRRPPRSEEHTSELQSLTNLVCRLLLEKKITNKSHAQLHTHIRDTHISLHP